MVIRYPLAPTPPFDALHGDLAIRRAPQDPVRACARAASAGTRSSSTRAPPRPWRGLQVGNERVAPAVGRREDAVEDDHPVARSAQHPGPRAGDSPGPPARRTASGSAPAPRAPAQQARPGPRGSEPELASQPWASSGTSRCWCHGMPRSRVATLPKRGPSGPGCASSSQSSSTSASLSSASPRGRCARCTSSPCRLLLLRARAGPESESSAPTSSASGLSEWPRRPQGCTRGWRVSSAARAVRARGGDALVEGEPPKRVAALREGTREAFVVGTLPGDPLLPRAAPFH